MSPAQVAAAADARRNGDDADLNSARAYQAARAGAEWAAFQILQNSGACAASTDKTFRGTLAPFTARVTCTTNGPVTEGALTLKAYSIVSTACNEPACPNTATQSATYVERQITLSIVQ